LRLAASGKLKLTQRAENLQQGPLYEDGVDVSDELDQPADPPVNGTNKGSHGSSAGTRRGKQSNIKQPRSLNKASGKVSTKGVAFSHQNWGGQTASYYQSIANRSEDVLNDIIAGALIWLATHDDPMLPVPGCDSTGNELDPRAVMCSLLPLFAR